MIVGLIPAGGKSSRMGRPKLSLPLGDRTVLEHVVLALRAGGVEHVLVVVGPHVPELALRAEAAGAVVCRLAEETPDMRATVQHGLRWLDDHLHPQPGDAWLLVPADHPTLEAAVVGDLLRAHAENPTASIVIPTYAGRRGHPALIGWKHVPAILALTADQGINSYLRGQQPETLELPVRSAAVLVDLDVPEDYERLRQQWPDRYPP
jgi:molybdenum cofactor cytidylyltransferase